MSLFKWKIKLFKETKFKDRVLKLANKDFFCRCHRFIYLSSKLFGNSSPSNCFELA